MRQMKDSNIPWIGEIPINWKTMSNKYLMKKVKDINAIYNGEDILSLSMKGVHVRDLEAGGKMPSTFDGYQNVYEGNLLMCLFDIDVTPRCIGLIKQDGITSPAYSQFHMEKIANSSYYYYYYLLLDYDKTLLHLSKNLRHSLTEEQLGSIKTLVPPIVEQRSSNAPPFVEENALPPFSVSLIREFFLKVSVNAIVNSSKISYIKNMILSCLYLS